MARKCGLCGESGHNKRTCPKNTSRAEKPMQAHAWRLRLGDKGKYVYRLQVNNVDSKSVGKLLQLMKDAKWKRVGDFYGGAEKQGGFVFQREFDTERTWIKFRNAYPYPLVEYSSTSNKVKFSSVKKITKKNLKAKKARKVRASGKKKAKRVCSFCCKPGHNKRTCSEHKTYLAKKGN